MLESRRVRTLYAQMAACGAERSDFHVTEDRDGRVVIEPIRPDDAMEREVTAQQRCVTRWAVKNGMAATAADWGERASGRNSLPGARSDMPGQ